MSSLQGAATENFSYDELPYESYSYRDTHPDTLYVLGKLFNMDAPDYKTARVLELGCAGGGNLLPYALAFPQSECTGVDLSATEIAEASRIKKETGVRNIKFLQKDIAEIGRDFGTFDYIIAHGVFSWVPDAVRTKMLELCRGNLAENGLAMISYNAYPGWHGVNPLRFIMRYHTQHLKTPEEKMTQARSLLNFLAQNISKNQPQFRHFVEHEIKTINEAHSTYLYHDHLAEINNPFYLQEFADMLAAHGLQYIGDTGLPSMYPKNLGAAAEAQLARIGDQVRREQYMDFLLNRRFRMSVIAHKDAKLDRRIKADTALDFYLTTDMIPENEASDPHGPVIFKKRGGSQQFSASDPVTAAFLLALNESGLMPVKISEIAGAVKEKLGLQDTAPVFDMARNCVIDFAFRGYLQLHAGPDDFVRTVSEKPRASPLVRQEIRDNQQRRRLTSLTRQSAATTRFSNLLLGHCDGTNSIDSLVAKMLSHAKNKDITMLDPDTKAPLKPEDVTQKMMTRIVRQTLEQFARGALLTG